MDFQKELEKYPDASSEERQELQKLASMQRDIAVSDSAEDFIRHPFFAFFEKRMNEMIGDSKGEMSVLLKKPGVTLAEVQAQQAGIDKIIELKAWLNSHVIKGRIARQAIEMYEKDTDVMNEKIQAAIDKSNQ